MVIMTYMNDGEISYVVDEDPEKHVMKQVRKGCLYGVLRTIPKYGGRYSGRFHVRARD